MRRRRVAAWLAGGAVVLTACGSPSTTEPAAQPAATDAPAAATAELPAQPDGTAPVETVVPDASANETAASDTAAPAQAAEASPSDSAAPDSTDAPPEPTAAPIATEPNVTDSPAAAALDAGCSVDNTATDVADGPVPTLEVRAESLASPLPDLAVRQINCAGGWVNLKNALPNDKPLLVWFWAPH